jgi:hypothetical protein
VRQSFSPPPSPSGSAPQALAAGVSQPPGSARILAPKAGRLRRAAILLTVPVVALVTALVPSVPAAASAPPRPIVSGWLPYWSTSASLASLKANANLFTEASPFWYTVNWTGTEGAIGINVSSSSKSLLKSGARNLGIGLWPTFTDSMPARRLAWVMNNGPQRAALVNKMVNLAVSEGYAGLDLDFENFAFSDGASTWSTTRAGWVQFVKDLAGGLHAHGIQLAATTPPLYSATSGYWVYDWKSIAPYIDRLRIMAYDYSWDSSGPIGPYPWAEKIVMFAVTQVPSGKIELGVAAYGREWATSITGSCPTSIPVDLAIHTFDTNMVPDLLRTRRVAPSAVQWSNTYKESFFNSSKTFTGTRSGKPTTCTVYRQAWYGSASAVAARASLVGKYQLAGLALWTIGGEDPGQWAMLKSYARTIAPSQTTITITANHAVGYGAYATVTATVSSQSVAVANMAVRLQFLRSGGSSWTPVATGTTDGNGRIRFRPTMTEAGTFRVVAPGTYLRSTGVGSTWLIRMESQVAWATSSNNRSHSAALGSTMTLQATVTPRQPGSQVLFQQWTGKLWRTITAITQSKTGSASLAIRPMRKGSYTYRFVVPASATVTGAMTRPSTFWAG